MKTKHKPLSRANTYVSNTLPWISVGMLLSIGLAAIGYQDWSLVALGMVGAAIIAWMMYAVWQQRGYTDALHQAYLKWHSEKFPDEQLPTDDRSKTCQG